MSRHLSFFLSFNAVEGNSRRLLTVWARLEHLDMIDWSIMDCSVILLYASLIFCNSQGCVCADSSRSGL